MSRLRRLVLSDRFSFITCRLLRGRARLAEGRTTEFEKAELCAPRFVNMDSPQGCIVMRPEDRSKIGTSGIIDLEVVE
jgi:hypothetical protein